MCWSQETSIVFAVVGFSVASYSAYKRDPAPFWLGCGYFASMELLQAITYFYIDDCSNPKNQLLTLLGYLHIVFQPFFINALALQFMPTPFRQRVQFPVYLITFACAVYMLLQLYPFAWAGQCIPASPMTICGDQWCAQYGNWHIAWYMPLNGLSNWEHIYLPILKGGFGYALAVFALPLIYGSWKFNLYILVTGPILAILLTDTPNEVAAIWCLFSTAILILLIKTPLRNAMYVKTWYGIRIGKV